MTAFWAAAWSALRLIEQFSPWFLGTVVRQFRFAMDVAFLLGWVVLVISAYQGGRCALNPFVHRLAVRLARKSAEGTTP